MPNVNQITFAGHLTRDAEAKHLLSGTQVANFGMAANHKYKEKEEVCFVDVACFGYTAEYAASLRKGQAVCVVGRLVFEQWEKDGQRHSKHKIMAHTVIGGAMPRPASQSPNDNRPESDDIPF